MASAVLEPPTPGPAGPTGPQGSAGSVGPAGPAGGNHLHTQNSPTTLWDVVHNLGYKPGGVQIIDSAGTAVEGDITHVDENHLQLRFTSQFSGSAAVS